MSEKWVFPEIIGDHKKFKRNSVAEKSFPFQL